MKKKKETTTEIEVELSGDDLVEEGIESFVRFAKVCESQDREVSSDMIIGYLAGYQGGLKNCGIPLCQSVLIGVKMSEMIKQAKEECGCGKCSK